MYQQNRKGKFAKARRYNVSGSRTKSNYWWGTLSLMGGFGFLITGLYSYYLNLLLSLEPKLPNSSALQNLSEFHAYTLASPERAAQAQMGNFWFFLFLKNCYTFVEAFAKSLNLIQLDSESFKILFFPQGLSMCFYGLAGILLGTYLWFCIFFGIGCGFTEFNKEKGTVRIFRLGFPGKNRVLDYSYTLNNIQCICVKFPSSVVPSSQRGVYIRLKNINNKTTDIPLDLYSEKTSLETIELQAADLSKFLKVSLSIGK